MDNSKRPKIAEGFRVGHLTVQSATEDRKNGYTVWNCVCDCGRTILLDTRTLQRGTVRDCGCITRVRPGQKDITGMRFGMLTAIAPAEQQDRGRAVWHCRCDCGGEIDAPLHQLTAGYRKSCGCLSHPPLEDLVGKTFGQLTVTGYAGKRNGRIHCWNCVCSCGNTTVVRQDYLKSGKTRSCGCLGRKQIQENLKLVDGTSVTILQSVHGRLRKNNTSGYTGVYQDRKRRMWHAQISFKGKLYDLGTYTTRKEAIKARMRGEEMHELFLAEYYEQNKEHPEKQEKTGA